MPYQPPAQSIIDRAVPLLEAGASIRGAARGVGVAYEQLRAALRLAPVRPEFAPLAEAARGRRWGSASTCTACGRHARNQYAMHFPDGRVVDVTVPGGPRTALEMANRLTRELRAKGGAGHVLVRHLGCDDAKGAA
jgi:hypothetical protein